FNFRGAVDPGDDVVIAAVDDASQMNLDMIWPFPRNWSAQLIMNLHKAGARVVNFDVLFDTEDKKNPGGDLRLREVINRVMDPSNGEKKTDVVLGTQLREEATGYSQLKQIISPNPVISQSAAHLSILNQPPDPDDVMRRSTVIAHVEEFNLDLPSYSFIAASLYKKEPYKKIMKDFFAELKKNPQKNIPLEFRNRLIPSQITGDFTVFNINFYGPLSTFRTFPYQDFLLMELDPDILLSPDADGDGKPDNAVIFHNLRDVKSQFITMEETGSYEAPTWITDAEIYEKTGSYERILALDTIRGLLLSFNVKHNKESGKYALEQTEPYQIGGYPAAIEIDRNRGSAYILEATQGALVMLNLATKEVTGKLPAANIRARMNQQVSSYEELFQRTRLVADFNKGVLYATLSGVPGVIVFDADSMETIGFHPANLMIKKIILNRKGDRLFVLGENGAVASVSLPGGDVTFFAVPPDASIASIAYFGFDHEPSNSAPSSKLVREKIYALNSNGNNLMIFSAEDGSLLNTLGLPAAFKEDFTRNKQELADIGQDAGLDDIYLQDVSASIEEGNVYIGAVSLVSGSGSMPSPDGVIYMLDAYTDQWYSNSYPIGGVNHSHFMHSSEGRVIVPATSLKEEEVFFLKVFDSVHQQRNYWEANSKRVAGKIALVGPTANALHDEFPTPFHGKGNMPGVEIHANAIQNLLDGNFIKSIGGYWVLPLLLILGVFAAILTQRMIHSQSIGVALFAVFGVIISWVFFSLIFFEGVTIFIFLPYLTLVAAIVFIIRYIAKFAAPPHHTPQKVLLAIARWGMSPLLLIVGIAGILMMVKPTLFIAVLKKMPILGLLGTIWALLILWGLFAVIELLPLFAQIFAAKPAGFTAETEEMRKRHRLRAYRSTELWEKNALAIMLFLVVTVGVVLLIIGEDRAAALLAKLGVPIFKTLTQNVLLPTIAPILTILLGTAVTTIYVAMTEGKEKKQIRGMFSKYVSSDVVNDLLENPAGLALGGKYADLTILFSDIRGFTTISEKLTAEQVVTVLNEYLSEMTGIVIEYQGTLDKFIGDAVMAFWGAPIPQDDHHERGLRAALKMHKVLKELKERWVTEGKDYPPINIGIGLNSGEVVVGNIGSDMRMDYTVIGDHVNLASRLEGQCKTYGVGLVVSESTLSKVKDKLHHRMLDRIAVKGKKEPVTIYEVIDFKD
ncbi:MAG: CHASE2 domain-containing protein, partial [bacterium]